MKTILHISKYLIFSFVLIDLVACSYIPSTEVADSIQVKGKVEVIGSSLAKGYMLKTDSRNSYLLDMTDEMAREINAEFPKIVTIQGRLYLGDWVGEKQACIEVLSWKLAD